MSHLISWKPFGNQSDEKGEGNIALPLSAHEDEEYPRRKRRRNCTSVLRTGIQFAFLTIACISLIKLAWFSPLATQQHFTGKPAANQIQPLDDNDIGFTWAFRAHGSRINDTCDKAFLEEAGSLPTDCSPFAEYNKVGGIDWQTDGRFMLCLFDDPICDSDLVASHEESKECLDAGGATTYRIVIGGTDCMAHIWENTGLPWEA